MQVDQVFMAFFLRRGQTPSNTFRFYILFAILSVGLLNPILGAVKSGLSDGSGITSLKTFGNVSTSTADALNQRAESFYNYHPDSTYFYASKALKVAESLGYYEGVIDAYRNLGGYFNRISSYDSAQYFLRKGLDLIKRYSYPKGQANLLSTLARTFEDRSFYTSAAAYYLRALRIKEMHQLTDEIPGTLNNLGLLAFRFREYDKALEYFQRALDMRKSLADEEGIPPLVANMALVYKGLGDYDAAAQLFHKSREGAEATQNEYLKSIIFHNLGLLALAQNNLALAKSNLEHALAIDQSMDEKYGVVLDLTALAQVDIRSKRYEQALASLQEALTIADTYGFALEKSSIHELISQIFEARNDGMPALRHHKIFKTLNDSIFNIDSTRLRMDLEARYHLEREEAEFTQIQREREIAKEAETAKLIRNFAIVILLILAIALIISIRSVHIHRKARAQMTQQKDEMEKLYQETALQKSRIEDIAKNLEEVNRTKDKLFSIVSHDLRSPINSLNSLMQYTLDESLSQEEFHNVTYKLKHEVEHVHFTLSNLLQWAKTQMKGITTDPTVFAFDELVAETVALYQPISREKNITIVNQLDSPVMCWADREQVSLILRNLLNNALKFTERGGQVVISKTSLSDNDWMFSIEDNGVGMDHQTISKLFKNNFESKRYGTAGEKGTGLGLILVKDFIERNNGTLSIKSQLGKGSVFSFTLPKNQ